MRLLLDTHVVLWWLGDDPLLPAGAEAAIGEPHNEVVVSAASVWEIGIKQAAGRLEAPDDLLEALRANDFQLLAIKASHTLDAARLPPHHDDPFDRMLIAQATSEALTLVTVDRRFSGYDVELLPLGA